MTNADLKTIETYCKVDACGEPKGGLSRSAQYSPRRMVFAGFLYGTYAKYRCPKCSFIRLFRLSVFQTHYIEKTSAEARREASHVVVAVVIVMLVMWGVDHKRTRDREAALAQQSSRLSSVTKEFIEIKPVFAEVYGESQVRVLIAAKLRSGAKAEPTAFAPPSGYFLDQDGNRYDPSEMLADNAEKVLDTTSPLLIVPGQVYRYYMVAPTHSRPDSDAPPSHTLTKLMAYLSGSPAQEVPLRRPTARDHASDEPDDDPNHFK